MRLEDWSVYNGCLVGRVYGHPDFDDGTPIITSHYYNLDTEARTAVTKHNTYKLGEPQTTDDKIFAKYEVRL